MGLTMSEERTTVRTTTTGSLRPVKQEVVSRTTDVTAVLVLYGMPRTLFCSVLAHECTHAYLKINSFPKMSLQTEEGLCQLVAYIYLQKQDKDPKDGDREKERLYHMNKIFEDDSEVYGEGFRKSFEAFTKYGLSRVLSHVKLTSTLPI